MLCFVVSARLSVPGVGCVALGAGGSDVLLRCLLVSLERSVVLGFLADSVMLLCLPGILFGSVELPVVVHVVLWCGWGILIDTVVLRSGLGVLVHSVVLRCLLGILYMLVGHAIL